MRAQGAGRTAKDNVNFMRAGFLNKQIHIMSPTATARSTDGQPIEVWSTLLSNIWAQVMPRTGDEVYRDRYRWEVEEVDFSIRWTSVAIEPEYRVRYDSSDYDIKAVINVAEADREIKLITTRHK